MAQTRLYGREDEVAQWRDLATAVEAGHSIELTVSGPSGIGKTTVLETLCADASLRGWKLLRAAGAARRSLPGSMFWQWFAPLAQQLPDHGPPFDGQGRVLHSFLTSAGGPLHKDALTYSASWVLRSLAQDTPVIAVVDDAQWLDELSLQSLSDMGVLLIGAPLLIVRGVRTGQGAERGDGIRTDTLLLDGHDGGVRHAASRSGTAGSGVPGPGGRVHWPLEPLDHRAVAEWAAHRAPSVDPAEAARIHAAAGGMPFYVHEILEGGVEVGTDRASAVAAVLEDRLARLSPEERTVLDAVVVLGEDASQQLLARMTGLPADTAIAPVLKRLAAARFLSSLRPRPRIQHALVAEAVLATLDPDRRAELHGLAAGALRAHGSEPALVAGHLLDTEPGTDTAAAEILLDAAIGARRSGSWELAVRLIGRAMAEEQLPAELQRRILVEASLAYQAAGRIKQAEEFGRRALAMTEGTRARVELLMDFAEAQYAINRVEESSRCFSQALKELENDAKPDTDLKRRVVAQATGAGLQQLQFASQYGQELADIMAQDPAEDGPSDRMLLIQEALRLSVTGADAKRSGELALRGYAGGKLLAEVGAESNIINYATGALNGSEQDAAALELLDAAIAEARANSSPMANATLSYCRGAIHLNRGRLRLAQMDLETAMQAADTGWRTYLEVACVTLAEIYIARDDLAAADALLKRVPLEEERVPLVQAMALQLHGVVTAGHGEHQEALEFFSAAMDLDAGVGPTLSLWKRSTIESAARAGQTEYAAAIAAELLQEVRSFGAPRLTGTVLRLAALAQPGRTAVVMLREAIALLEAHEGRYQLALALADLAETCLSSAQADDLQGFRAEALAAARKSLVLANRIGAATVAHRMTRLLAEQDSQLPLIAENKADRLTPAEYRVCALAAKGLTNRKIAAELFITIKAVEWHLSRSFTKLEISSRKALPTVMDPQD
ncbi:AAA family ATPase [Arthrobacter sp.]|uniref:helix-turn-helix transcriptional regulator n=1 Tax=Arthrobacter sp. TaxID=1667 RepID=UPI003394BC74